MTQAQHTPAASRRGAPPAIRAAATRPQMLSTLALAAALAWTAVPLAAQAQNAAVPIQIAAQPLNDALLQLGRQTALQFFYTSELVQGIAAPAVHGSLTPEQALQRLLQGSGLRYSREGNSITLARAPVAEVAPGTLPEVVVTAVAQDGRTEGTGNYGSSYASFGKGQSVRETPQSVSIVTRQRIEDQNLNTLTDVLNQTTGITVVQGGEAASFTSRGFDVQNIQLDGGAPIGGVSSGFNWESTSHLDMAQFDRVEVLRGADGLFSGSGEPGGVINLVRKRPLAERQILFNASAGRWNNYRSELDVTNRLSQDGRIRGRAVLAWQNREFFYDHAKSDNKILYGVLEADLTPSTLVSLGASYQRADIDGGLGGGLPRYSNGDDIGLPRSTNYVAPWGRTAKTTKQAFASLDQQLGDDWNLKVNALLMERDYDSRTVGTWGAVDPLTGTGHRWWSNSPYEFTTRNVSVDATIKGNFEALGRSHDLRFGIDFQRNDSALYDGSPVGVWDGSQIDLWDPQYPADVAGSARDGNVYDPRDVEQSGLFGALRLHVAEPLKLVVGGRYSRFKTELYTPATRWSSASVVKFSENGIFVPYGGLTYDINDRWTGYASVAESYVSQAKYLNGPPPGGSPLDPVTGRNFEIGVKGELWDGRLNTSLALYRIKRTGEAQRDPNYPDGTQNELGVACCYINSSERISQGLDAEISGEVRPGWQVFAGYTYNSNKDKGAGTGRFSTRTPKHLLKLHTTYRLPGEWNALKLGGGVTAQSSQYVSGTSNTWNADSQQWNGSTIPFSYTQAGYALWNVSAEYRFNPNWGVSLGITNLFDKTYYQTMGTNTGGNYYGEPRNYVLTLRGRF